VGYDPGAILRDAMTASKMGWKWTIPLPDGKPTPVVGREAAEWESWAGQRVEVGVERFEQACSHCTHQADCHLSAGLDLILS
jgi:hypothetical protein